ncbi:MAG: ABC transporter ATP-binding protein [Chitinophagaceae bacterium]|nr:MAG: ABC transporter ATP-binding protein [Chitinophagaceae bacterium]
MGKLLRYFGPYKWLFLVLLIFIIGQVIANLSLPDYMANIVDHGIVGQDRSVVRHYGLIMLLVALGGGVCTVIAGYAASRIGTGFAKDVRNALFKKIEGFSLSEFNQFSTASLITRNTNDVQQIQTVLIMVFRLALMAPLMGVVAIIKSYGLAPSMTWIMIVAVVTLVIIIAIIFSMALPRFARLQKLVDRLNLVTREILTGLRVIRAFGQEKREESKFRQANQDLTDVNLFVNRLMAILQPSMMLIMNFTMIGIVWIGAHEIDADNLQIGNMLAFMQYAMQAIFAFLMISIIFIMLPRASISAKRIAEVLQTELTIQDPVNPITTNSHTGQVEFRNVSFTYAGSEASVLHNISFTALPGQTTAIVGSTGSGKSTLINLIPRFYDVNDGEILVDGIDIRQMTQQDLRSRIGYVSQKAMLFSGTIKDNIGYGVPGAREEELQHAADISQATEFIRESANGMDNAISQAGTNVSGGQRQRLAIARALAKKPDIYLFDDSFSALDFKTDALLRQALKEETKGKTVIIVAQRISTIMQAEKILVIDNGAIVGQGTHRELLGSSEVYREIAGSQLSEKELAQGD